MLDTITPDLLEQGSPEWHAMRLGKVTASRIGDVMAKTKSGPAASRANYRAELVAERLTGVPFPHYVSQEMQRGTDMEGPAREAYEFYRGVTVDKVGFCTHPGIADAGASPDGLVGKDGMVEIKCPNTSTHIETLLGGILPARYLYQVQFQMACAGRRWVDWCSFDDRMPEDMRLFVLRVERDETLIADVVEEVVKLLVEVDSTIAQLIKQYRS